MRVHIDTDFAGDTGDACAVALVLGSDDVELIGMTTVADPDGMRAGYLDYFLQMAGRAVPIAAGAGRSLATGEVMGGLPDHATYWGSTDVAPLAGPDAAAVELLEASVASGATIVAIGPFTNLALLDAARPDLLRTAKVVLMGGWIAPARLGLPAWGPDMDWNVHCDIVAAETVFKAAGDLTLATLTATFDSHVRQTDIHHLRASGVVGHLLARQLEAYGRANEMFAFGRAHLGLPDDLLNFQYDVAACAIAVGLPVAELEELVLTSRRDGGVLRFQESSEGRAVTVTTAVDGPALNKIWLDAIERVDATTAK